MEDTFESSVERSAGYTVVAVAGELDVATAPDLRGRLEETFAQEPAVVVVDLLRVTFIDSTALGVLIEARKEQVAQGRHLRIVIADPRIMKVFQITGLTDLFDIHPTREDAVAG